MVLLIRQFLAGKSLFSMNAEDRTHKLQMLFAFAIDKKYYSFKNFECNNRRTRLLFESPRHLF